MRSTKVLALSALTGSTLALATVLPLPYAKYAKGFSDATIRSSVGGHAICIEGTINVTASAENINIKVDPPKNQIELTNLISELTQINSTLGESIIGGSQNISDTYGIYSQICLPTTTKSSNTSTVQFLVHGGGFDRLYWDNALGYSYVDYAAEQGYTTFSYDRLGTGSSDHPDPINVVQTTLHVAIAHELVALVRSGEISGIAFDKVAGVGHSYGSAQLLGITHSFPDDLDAVVLTGASADPSGYPALVISQVYAIASQSDPLRFSNISSGYVLPGAVQGLQYAHFRASFDPHLLDVAEATKQPQGLGEILLPFDLKPSADFAKPVYVLNGEKDLPICEGDCLIPRDRAAELIPLLFPNASGVSGSYLVPETGHSVNFHYGARDAYDHIMKFLVAAGI